ncbi:MAG: HD domain-containing protein [Desulfovibrio sp.]|nr:HD domain-containing protein [Desulfovibrio sp.]
MGRLKELRKIVDQELLTVADTDTRKGAYVHLYGVSLSATLIAEKRGENSELAAMAAMLHDLYAYKSGSYEDHANKGAELASAILKNLGLTTDAETEAICTAIRRHDDKDRIDGALDEVLKDADVMHHTMNDLSKAVKEKEAARYSALRQEFGLG